ncbi:MAG: SRPBCC family protein [Myxococcota bacterium]|nr:SRPBCC family protein [Myxococcota bacterium]
MGETRVKQNVDVPADRLWDLIADFGDMSWLPDGGANVRTEGSGPGMSRLIGMGDATIREELVSVDPGTRTLMYTIPENVPFPVTDYRATIRVSGSDDGAEVDWSCTFEPVGVSEAQAAEAIQGMYGTMIGWIRDRAKAL